MKLEKTKDYTLFISNSEQRPVDDRHAKRIGESIDLFGFLPSKPLQCYRKGSKLVLVDGHHRLAGARAVGADVYYVVEEKESQQTMAAENLLVKKWSAMDFIRLYASRGLSDYKELLRYQESGIPLTMAASMLIGEGAGSSNAGPSISSGKFKIKTREVIDKLLSLFDQFEGRAPAIKSRPFISLFSKCIFTPEFDFEVFEHKLSLNPTMLDKTSNEDQMMRQIEDIYNWSSREKIPLAFLVSKNSKERHHTFGGKTR
jgi:hypothetical protein